MAIPGPIALQPDTIAAVATATGEGGIGIVRVSGPAAGEIGDRLFRGRGGRPLSASPPFHLTLGVAVDATGAAVDEVLAVRMPAGRSYTGEETVEIQAHGGPAVLEAILGAAVDAGARLAQPGEFTRRAFLGGRIDLAQAEAVAELIAARSAGERRRALRQLQGRGGEEIRALRLGLLDILARGEALLDFGEEEGIGDPLPVETLAGIGDDLRRLLNEGRDASWSAEGDHIVLVGPPNSGKSSLFNVLCDSPRAIVAPTPGTTRDYLEERTTLHGVRVTLTDTAGIRETGDDAEAEGIRRALARAAEARLVVLVVDGSVPADDHTRALAGLVTGREAVVAVTKSDLEGCLDRDDLAAIADALPVHRVSVVTGHGCDALAREIAARCRRDREWDEEGPALNVRHRAALSEALLSLERSVGRGGPTPTLDLALLEIRRAIDALGGITGETAGDEVLDRIFSRFCVGK